MGRPLGSAAVTSVLCAKESDCNSITNFGAGAHWQWQDSTCILGLNKKKNWELKFGGKRIFGKKAAPTKRTREDGRRDRK
jgi:hypothetical protein